MVHLVNSMYRVLSSFTGRSSRIMMNQTCVGLRFSSTSSYEMILTEKRGAEQNVGLITLNRPKVLNALSSQIIREISDAITKYSVDDSVKAIVITGSEKSFASGDDLKELTKLTFLSYFSSSLMIEFDNLTNRLDKCKKPVIAAVNGYALGGGCELAMLCDIIYAGEKASFSQAEIIYGVIPGLGGTQRTTRSIGRSKAMEMCLTGIPITAQEAENLGLVSKVFPADKLVDEAIKTAEKIASHSPLIVSLCKEAVNTAWETSLQEGLKFERRTFYSTLATNDRKEGITAFVEKRKPVYTNS